MRNRGHQVTRSLDDLTRALVPFIEERLESAYGMNWRDTVRDSIRNDRIMSSDSDEIHWDVQALLTVMWDHWNSAFRTTLGFSERSLVSELREYRNRWAHQTVFDFEDTYRILDSVERLLRAIGSPVADEVRTNRRDLLRDEFTQQASHELLQAQMKRKRLGTVLVYLMSCSALLVSFIATLGWKGWLIGLPVVALFLFFSILALRESTVMFGPHECPRCGRIIYSAGCPYCNPTAAATVPPAPTEPLNA